MQPPSATASDMAIMLRANLTPARPMHETQRHRSALAWVGELHRGEWRSPSRVCNERPPNPSSSAVSVNSS
jgi:hypothetical protein